MSDEEEANDVRDDERFVGLLNAGIDLRSNMMHLTASECEYSTLSDLLLVFV